MVWNRVILPDSSLLTLDSLVGTNPACHAGQVDGMTGIGSASWLGRR